MERLPIAVQRFLDGVRTADWDGMEQHFTPDAVYDGSMPGWRAQYQGPDRIVQAYREDWTGKGSWSLSQTAATMAGDTLVLELEGTIVTPTGGLLCRLANFFELHDGRIAQHRYYCSGEWDEDTVRHIAAHAPKVERAEALA